ncbi:MAG: hypothetical protein ABWY54_01775 [Glaciihabitans sp.]
MDKTQRDPSEYIDSLPEPVRRDIHLLDEAIAGVMPDAERVMWEGVFWGGTEQHIIGYGELVQPRPGKKTVEWFVVGLTVQKDAISVYVNAVEHGQYLAEKYASTLGTVSTGKSVIRFRTASDLNLEALLDLVRRATASSA